jgi:hypothetical protein
MSNSYPESGVGLSGGSDGALEKGGDGQDEESGEVHVDSMLFK